MQMIKDLDAQLTALKKRKASLAAKRLQQLGQLVVATGGGNLKPEVIAGIMLAAISNPDEMRMEAWHRRGAAFFRERGWKTQHGDADDGSCDESDNGSDQSAGE